MLWAGFNGRYLCYWAGEHPSVILFPLKAEAKQTECQRDQQH